MDADEREFGPPVTCTPLVRLRITGAYCSLFSLGTLFCITGTVVEELSPFVAFGAALLLALLWILFRGARRSLSITRVTRRMTQQPIVVRKPCRLRIEAFCKKPSARFTTPIHAYLGPSHFLDSGVAETGGGLHGVEMAGLESWTLELCVIPTSAGRSKLPATALWLPTELGLLGDRLYQDQQIVEAWPQMIQGFPTEPHRVRTPLERRVGIHHARRVGLGSELHELREYQPGDPSRFISWRATAKRGKLMVQEPESEVPVPVTLVLDNTTWFRGSEQGPHALETAISAAMGIVDACDAVHDPVGALVLNDDDHSTEYIPPSSSSNNRYRIVRAIIRCRNGLCRHEQVDLERLQVHAARSVAHCSLLPVPILRTRSLPEGHALCDWAWNRGVPLPTKRRDPQLPGGSSLSDAERLSNGLRHAINGAARPGVFVILCALWQDEKSKNSVLGAISQVIESRNMLVWIAVSGDASTLDGVLWNGTRIRSQSTIDSAVKHVRRVRELEWFARWQLDLRRLGVLVHPLYREDKPGQSNSLRVALSAVNWMRREIGGLQ